MHWRRKWQPTPVFSPGEFQGRGSLVGCRLWGRTEPDTEATQQQQLQQAFLVAQTVKSIPASAGEARNMGLVPGSGKSLEEEMATHPVFLPRKSHG